MKNANGSEIRKVLILGHKGFIGQHLSDGFNGGSPKVEVIGRDLPEVDLTSWDSVQTLSPLFQSDTAVIMLSAVKRQFGDTIETFTQNLSMTTNLCRLLQECPVGRFVFFSSTAVYGEDVHNTDIIEVTPVCPTSYYGMVKYISERLYWKAMQSAKDSPLLILRPAMIYGPGDNGDTYGPVRFAHGVKKQEMVTLWGDGTELREFLSIKDITDIVHKLVFNSAIGVFNIVCGKSYSFLDVINVVESVSSRKIQLNSQPRTKEKVDHAFSNTNLLQAIGPYEFTSLTEGVKAVYEKI